MDHPLLIENDLVGVAILKESPDEQAMYHNISKNTTINFNSKTIVISLGESH